MKHKFLIILLYFWLLTEENIVIWCFFLSSPLTVVENPKNNLNFKKLIQIFCLLPAKKRLILPHVWYNQAGPSMRLVLPEVRLFSHLLVDDSDFGYKQKFLKENSSQ
jgi:hypothetical protein